jgi:beta-lactamase regulating signal transducer with metallopeptidase domain
MNPLIALLNLWAEHFRAIAWPMLWQSSLLIGLLFALDIAWRRKLRAGVRYALWLVVLLKLVMPPSLALPTGVGWWLRSSAPVSVVPHRPAVVVTQGSENLSVIPEPLPALALIPPVAISLSAWALLASTGTSFGLLTLMLIRWRKFGQDTRSAWAVPENLREIFEEARRSTGFQRLVQLKVINQAISPAVCGLVHPVVLVPRSLAERLAPDQMRAILLHELMHLRRGDVWVNCLQALLQVVYWWHPLLWLANARIRTIREEAVDDAVMVALENKSDTYAPTLLQVAKLALRRPLASLGLVGILESQGSLRRRIERLLNFNPPRRTGVTFASALFVVAFGALALPMGEPPAPVPTVSLASQPASTNEQKYLVAGRTQDAEGLTESSNFQAADKPFETNQSGIYRLFTSASKKGIYKKLDDIRLERVEFNNVTLSKVVRFLAVETKKRDPAGRGVNFLISPFATIPDPSSVPFPADLGAVSIKLSSPLDDVRIADVLDVMCKFAEKPIKYSIEDYAVVFSWRSPDITESLHTRIIQVDPNTFLQGLELKTGAAMSQSGSEMLTNRGSIRDFVQSLGLDLKPPKSIYYSHAAGRLIARATLKDLEAIEAAIQTSSVPQVSIEVKFFEVPEEIVGQVVNQLNATNRVDHKGTEVIGALTPSQALAFKRSMGTEFGIVPINDFAVTTLSGRQTQIQSVDIQNIATNVNPLALTPPGISLAAAEGPGLYLTNRFVAGPSVDVIPYVSTNGYTIQITAIATMTDFLGYARSTNSVTVYVDGKPRSVPLPLPDVRVSQVASSAMIWDGQSMVLMQGRAGEFSAGSGAEKAVGSAAKRSSSGKRLLTILTPSIIDPTGNRVHTDEEVMLKATSRSK